jgi:hypothetical protein
MLFPEIESLPNLRSAALYQVFAIGIRRLVVDHELDDLLGPVVAPMALDQSIDRCFHLKQFGS